VEVTYALEYQGAKKRAMLAQQRRRMTMQRSQTRVRINAWRAALVGSLLIVAIGAAEPIEVGFRGPFYPPGTAGNSRPTAEKPESKLWFNENSWWGILWSTAGNAYHIHRLDPVTQEWVDTGTVVDDRSASRADVGWDGQHLYVVSHVFSEIGQPAPAGQRGELYRFSYNGARKHPYKLDPGYPVEVTGGTSETLVLEKDSASQLWVTWVENGRVMVNHSLNGDDRTWAQPFVLPAAGADSVGEDDISSIISFNGHIGVMWSDQDRSSNGNEGRDPIAVRMLFAVHQDGQDAGSWQSTDVYTPSGDDHINFKALQSDGDGNVFAVIKTDKDAKLIMLLVCKTTLSGCRRKSDWSHFEVYRSKVFDPTRPMLLIDAEKRELYVFAVIEDDSVIDDQRAIYYKKTPIDAISFSTDIGVPFIKSPTDININDPTSTKQNLNSTTGLVVLASDEVSTHYFHNFLTLR
jgi:hypothetical protein